MRSVISRGFQQQHGRLREGQRMEVGRQVRRVWPWYSERWWRTELGKRWCRGTRSGSFLGGRVEVTQARKGTSIKWDPDVWLVGLGNRRETYRERELWEGQQVWKRKSRGWLVLDKWLLRFICLAGWVQAQSLPRLKIEVQVHFEAMSMTEIT